MIRYWTVALALLIYPAIAAPICVDVPLRESLRSASIVFVATLTSAKLQIPSTGLVDDHMYKINYEFEVRERLKGNPSLVTSIYGYTLYSAPGGKLIREMAEQVRFSPGDNVLVISDAGDVPLTFCSPSRAFDESSPEVKQLRREHAL